MSNVTKPASSHSAVTTGWTNPSNAFDTANDGVFATAAPGRNATVNGDFGFTDFTATDIPDNSTINSVVLTFNAGMTAAVTGGIVGGQIRNNGVSLGSETTGTATAQTTYTQTVLTGITLTDLRSASTLIKARVRCSKGATNTAMTGDLDFVCLTVNYTLPPPFSGDDSGDGAGWSLPYSLSPMIAGVALAAGLLGSALNTQAIAQAGNEEIPQLPRATDTTGIWYSGSPQSTMLGTGVRYAFAGDEPPLTSVLTIEDSWYPIPLPGPVPIVIPLPFGWVTDEVVTAPVGSTGVDDGGLYYAPSIPPSGRTTVRYAFGGDNDIVGGVAPPPATGVGTDALTYGPRSDASSYSSGVRYSVSGDEIMGSISVQEDYWNDPQKDIDGFAVTVALPFSWDEQDSVVPQLTSAPDATEAWRVLSVPWGKPVVPQPFAWVQDERPIPTPLLIEEQSQIIQPLAWQPVRVLAQHRWEQDQIPVGLDEHSQIIQPLRWAGVRVPPPWIGDNQEVVPVAAPIQPDDDGQLVRPLRWAAPKIPAQWTFDAETSSFPHAVPNGPLGIVLAASHIKAVLAASEAIINLSHSVLKIDLQE